MALTAARSAVLFTIGTALSVSLASQSPQSTSPPIPTFRAEVEYVEVDALVTDEQGRFVPDLQKKTFESSKTGSLRRSQILRSWRFR